MSRPDPVLQIRAGAVLRAVTILGGGESVSPDRERRRVRLLLGCHVDELERPEGGGVFVAGCIDGGTYEVLDWDEIDKWLNELKDKFDPERTEYEFRECWATFDSARLGDVFPVVTVEGEVDGDR